MPIRVYNTLSKSKEEFQPLEAGKVGIYLCGPTVYRPSHIGHMVGPVIFDCIKRYLTYCGFQVTLVINITDVDDKLIAESNRRQMSMADLAREMTDDYFQNLAAVNVDTVDHFPRATEHMDEIIRFTGELVEKGFAYASGGDVYFSVERDPEYGKLSRRGIESLVGEGGDMADRKRAAADFALWKSAKPGEPSWESPWGPGRPGWHIECSAMSRRLLGPTFDIHGGGLDLVFPHHENEIAQSECCHGKPQARYWLHNGLMQASSEIGKLGGRNTRELSPGDQQAQEAGKLGKSKGASAFRDLLRVFSGETIRFFVLSTQYRRPIDFSEERIREVEKGLDAFYRFFQRYQRVTGESWYSLKPPRRRADGEFDLSGEPALQSVADHRTRFLECMDDDFNTGGGMGELFELVRTLNRLADEQDLEGQRSKASGGGDASGIASFRRGATVLCELAATLGLFVRPVEPAAEAGDELAGKLMALLIDLRAEARGSKNFALADRIRKSLTELGVTLEDRPAGTQWTRQRQQS